MNTEATYNSFEKNSYHFRKRLPHRHLVDYTKDTMYRISLRKVAKSYYYILSNDVKKLNELTRYINRRLCIFLELKEVVVLDEISEFIYSVCEDYREEAIKENSFSEIKRVEALEYTNENGVQAGHSLQAITRAYKEVSSQYHNMTTDTQKTYELGSMIVKRSNITKEQLLEIPENKRLEFFEMLIKAEKYILEQDLKLYIKRNLYQFSNLITDFEEPEGQQAGKAFAEYLDIVNDNKPQINYLQFMKKTVKHDASFAVVNREKMVGDILKIMKTDEKDKLLNVSASIDSLINQFIEYKKFTKKREDSAVIALRYFADYLKGNGKEYKPKNITDLTIDDLLEFQELLINCAPKDKKRVSQTLFEGVKLLKETNCARYALNSMSGIQGFIKPFWKYLSKYHKSLKLDRDIIDIFNPKAAIEELKEDSAEQDASLRAFTMSELNKFIETAYGDKELKKTLINSPRNFYVFLFSLLTGTRLEESLLISLNDIKVQEKYGKRYFYIYLNENEKYQHLKNPNAHRNIPITDLMISLGLLNHIKRRHKNNQKTLFDFPNSASSALSMYYRRYFQILFPEDVDSRKNRNLKVQKNFIQYRSLRKNYSDFLFGKNRTEYDTEANKKRLMGHSYGTTSIYLGRLEPYLGCTILNAIEYDELDFNRLITFIRKYWVTVIYDLDWLKEGTAEEWKEVSTVKRRRGKKV